MERKIKVQKNLIKKNIKKIKIWEKKYLGRQK
jgi:hypothetical protein